MPEGNIGGRFKTIEEADKGIAEMLQQIATLTGDRDRANNEITQLKAPKPPAFADDQGFEKYLGEKKVDVNTLIKNALTGQTTEKDAEAIGAILREADPKWLGRQFATLKDFHIKGSIEGAQRTVYDKVGGKAKLDTAIERAEKAMKPDEMGAWRGRWNDAKQAEGAAFELIGRFAPSEPGRSPAESAFSTTTTSGGIKPFASKDEFAAVRAASIAKYGPDHYRVDADFKTRYEATPVDVRRTF